MEGKRMDRNGLGNTNWVLKEGDADDEICDSTSIGSFSEDSMNSLCSSSSSQLNEEEADSSTSTSTSTSTSSSSSHSNGPLYELSQLIHHLPIKRGLSKFYEGKAQSFTSLARIQSIEDLPKKATPHRKKIKSCKSYGAGLDGHRISYTPKPAISKKSSRGSSISVVSKRGSFLSISVNNNF